MLAVSRHLGAYPTDANYDPNRPSWFPYWLNTPTEVIRQDAINAGRLLYGLTPEQVLNPATAYPMPASPRPAPSPTGDTLTVPPASEEEAQAAVNAVIQAQHEGQAAQTRAFFSRVSVESADATKPTISGSWLLIGAAVIGALILLRK